MFQLARGNLHQHQESLPGTAAIEQATIPASSSWFAAISANWLINLYFAYFMHLYLCGSNESYNGDETCFEAIFEILLSVGPNEAWIHV